MASDKPAQPTSDERAESCTLFDLVPDPRNARRHTARNLAQIETALKDPAAGVVGPFGIVTTDLREFDEAPDEGPCDAVEGYLMAFRREVLTDVGGFDEKFRW